MEICSYWANFGIHEKGKIVSKPFRVYLKIYIPVKIHELRSEIAKTGRFVSGTAPTLLQNKLRIETFVLQRLVEITQKRGTHLILLILGNGDNWCNQFISRHQRFLTENKSNLTIVDAEGALCSNLKNFNDQLYQKAYMHWAGNPPELVDRHPNDYSHQIIAQEILKYIR